MAQRHQDEDSALRHWIAVSLRERHPAPEPDDMPEELARLLCDPEA